MTAVTHTCSAKFTLNGQTGNQKVTIGSQVTLQANDPTAEIYSWEVASSPPDAEFNLENSNQAETLLALNSAGAFVITLIVTKAGQTDLPHALFDSRSECSCEPFIEEASLL